MLHGWALLPNSSDQNFPWAELKWEAFLGLIGLVVDLTLLDS